MYPNLYFAFKDLFGIEWSFLRFVNSFGFFVAIAFIIAAIVLAKELQRKSAQGLLQPTEIDRTVGQPATIGELVINFLLGFILGYKIVALFIMSNSATEDPQAFIFSELGSWPAGIILGLLFAGLKWYEKNKQKLPKPEKRVVRIWPQDRVGEITILALIFGLVGAKLFDIFENWSDFVKKPSQYLFSPAGLTFYGGLICAALAIWLYARKHKIGFWHLNDAAAPALMIAYAVGRIGCQVSGDGDWGIYNSAYAVDANSNITAAAPGQFEQTLLQHSTFFLDEADIDSLGEVPHKSFKRPGALSFLPVWFFAYDYPNNVNEHGVALATCDDPKKKFCNHLPAPVFPTPLYEVIFSTILFVILWICRKKMRVPGTLFALYLVVNGLERFLIEKIRVNNKLSDGAIKFTQAELISFFLIVTGIILWIVLTKRSNTRKSTTGEALGKK